VNAEKVYINPNAQGVIRIEKAHLQLEDRSRATFNTDSLVDFEEFVRGNSAGASIFFSASKVVLVENEVTHLTKPRAVCDLSISEPLRVLTTSLNKPIPLVGLERLLTSLRRYGQVLSVISELRNLVVSKNLKFERQVDNKANFKLHIERTGAAGDWQPPESLKFTVPVFNMVPDTIEIESDFVFTMKDEDGGAPVFELQNLTWSEDLQERKRQLLEKRLGEMATCPKYWGSHALHELTDGKLWKDISATL
jgi:hypothetical protein